MTLLQYLLLQLHLYMTLLQYLLLQLHLHMTLLQCLLLQLHLYITLVIHLNFARYNNRSNMKSYLSLIYWQTQAQSLEFTKTSTMITADITYLSLIVH